MVGIVGATAIERADGDIRPYGYSLVGAAVLSGPSITATPPWSPSSVMGFAHATFSPAGRRLWPFRRERSNVDGVPLIRHGLRRATFPQGKAFFRKHDPARCSEPGTPGGVL